MGIFRSVCFSCSLVLALGAQAQEFPTIFPALGNENPTELDALTGRCTSEDDGETLSCLFITVIVNYEAEDGSVTCKLWGTAGNEILTRAAPGTWSNRSEPSGNCGVVNTVELACNPEALMECEYFEQSTYTITTGEYCEYYATVEDPGDRYSWRVSDKRELNCDYVEFNYQ